MADVNLSVAGRNYSVACRDGEEAHLLKLAEMVDKMAHDVAQVGTLSENRTLLFSALFLADKLHELQSAPPSSAPVSTTSNTDIEHQQVAIAVEKLADRMEELAERLENGGASA